MKKAVVFSSLAMAALVVAMPVSAKTLKAAHYLSPKHPVGLGYQLFADTLKAETKGSLSVRIFAGESLLGAKALSDGVRDGVADMAFEALTYTPSYYPHGILMSDLAMVGEDDMAAAFAITELFTLHCKPCLAEFQKQNQVFITMMSTGPYVLVGNTDVNGVAAIKGKKLRAGGPLWDRFARYAGATGVNIPSSEIYESLSRGIVDAAMIAIGSLKSNGLADVAKQVVVLPLGSWRAGSLFSTNRDTWSALTTEERRAYFKAATIAMVKVVDEYAANDDAAIGLAKEKGIPVQKPAPDLAKLRADFVEADLPTIIADAKGKLGIADAEEFVATYKQLYAKYDGLIPPVRKDPTKLAALLYAEVFAKLDPATYEVK